MLVYYSADIAEVMAQPQPLRDDVVIRPAVADDVTALASAYLTAYDPPVVSNQAEAIAEVTSTFDGAWGELWPEASPAAWIGDDLVGVVQTVRRPSWDGAPDYPWIIEVFVAPPHRRTGLARTLIMVACGALRDAGEPRIGLTVDQQNAPAVHLYETTGFRKTS